MLAMVNFTLSQSCCYIRELQFSLISSHNAAIRLRMYIHRVQTPMGLYRLSGVDRLFLSCSAIILSLYTVCQWHLLPAEILR